ncbi:MAG: hypothetical protein QOJ86_2278 [Bradyrhizobium sp.]|nr:hypothetical protein [Bradyrhizobium sp.]
MARTYRSNAVRYWVTEPVEIEAGWMLPAGSYTGVMEEHGIETFKGVSWGKPRYGLELSAERLEEFGRKPQRGLDSNNYDLSRWIESGEVS